MPRLHLLPEVCFQFARFPLFGRRPSPSFVSAKPHLSSVDATKFLKLRIYLAGACRQLFAKKIMSRQEIYTGGSYACGESDYNSRVSAGLMALKVASEILSALLYTEMEKLDLNACRI